MGQNKGEVMCPDCGDTGIGLLGVHEIPGHDWINDGDRGFWVPTMEYQEEYGTPCPTCGREEEKNDKDSQG